MPRLSIEEPVEKIARFECQLSPAIALEGKPVVHWTLAERLAHYAVPGVGIAVINGGRVEWARGYGVLEAGRNARVTPESRFQAASISKPVSCLGAMRLVEQGVLSLDQPVNERLQSWKVPDNELTRDNPVTLRRLMSHTAGLTVHGFPGYPFGQPLPTLVQVLDGEPPANSAPVRVDIRPGERFRYSGGGTCVMQLLMTEATGQPFPHLMRELVLGPLGMTSSTFESFPQGYGPESVARAHREDGSLVPGGWHLYPEIAPAGLWTTPTDLCRFAIALQQGHQGAPGSVLSQRLVREMLTPVAPNDWRESDSYIALGPGVFTREGITYFMHGGGNQGFRCVLIAARDLREGVAIMTNGDAGTPLVMEMVSGVANTYGWPGLKPDRRSAFPLPALTLAAYAGNYELMPGVAGEIRVEGDHLVARVPQMGTVDLYPSSETEFFGTADTTFKVTFARDASGRATELRIPAAGIVARRVG